MKTISKINAVLVLLLVFCVVACAKEIVNVGMAFELVLHKGDSTKWIYTRDVCSPKVDKE